MPSSLIGRSDIEFNHKKLYLTGGMLIILLLIGLMVFLSKKPLSNPTITDQLYQSPTPSPFPFQEMTIPFLRAKNYQTKLSNLNKISDSDNFSSYLTSYTSDGLKINGLLTIPTEPKPAGGFPAIVFIHGYIPPNQYVTTERYVDYVNYLARSGYVVFKIDLRGHGSSAGEAGGAYYSSDYVIDTLSAYSALANADFVNPHRIGLWGHSMAGNIVLRALAAKPDIPVAVIWAGAGFTYLDLTQYRINDQSYRPQPSDSDRTRQRNKLRDLYGNPDPNNWFWKLVIPTNFLTDFKGAIQLDHAVDDQTVNIEYSRNLNQLLDQTSIPHKFHEYPSGDHNITTPSFTPAMENTVKFYDRYLK